MPYPEELVAPMRQELKPHGVEELCDAASVDGFMNRDGATAMLFFNSVCGCAAGSARPGIAMALAGGVKPDRVGMVFAGQDQEATDRARSFCAEVPPSSPSAAFFKKGELAHFIPRHLIEGQHPEFVARLFTAAFVEHCS